MEENAQKEIFEVSHGGPRYQAAAAAAAAVLPHQPQVSSQGKAIFVNFNFKLNLKLS